MRAPLFIALLATIVSCGGDDGGGAGPDAGPPPNPVDGGADGGSNQLCTGTLCGNPAVCCDDGNECIQGECLITCDSGVRCGADQDVCCNAGEVCVANSCAVPGAACQDSYDCTQPGEFCEPTIGECLPQPDPLLCEIQPVFGDLDVTIEASFDREGVDDLNEEIISIPVVADIDGDGVPEVVVNIGRQGGDWPIGRIAVLDGADISVVEQGPFAHDPDNDSYGSHGRSTIALGDVNGDDLPDIIYGARPTGGPTGAGLASNVGPIVAIDFQGNLLWTSHDAAGNMTGYDLVNAIVTTANLDSDKEAEVIIGSLILDHDGTVLNAGSVSEGSDVNYRGGISAVADLDGDGVPEIISGRNAYKVTITQGTPVTASVSTYWDATTTGPEGYPAVADFNNDGVPEVVIVGSSELRILNGQTGELFCARASCADPSELTQPVQLPGGTGSNRGGPPTISDFDADGRPEIGVAGGFAYIVYDLNRPTESLQAFGNDLNATPLSVPPAVGTGELFPRWMYATQDASSNATGSSVFDFQGDGAAEVVYGDECFMRVFSGTDGSIQLEVESTSATIHEYPLVVDVDADGNSEILIVSQITNAANNCGAEITARQGLYVYGDVNDEWVPTRRVWTQHTYHVTNSGSDGNVPMTELDNWDQPGLNNYRQNVQGDGVFNAPDLGIDLSIGLGTCEDGQLVLQARVSNLGALGVPPGVEVEFFEGNDATGTALGTATTPIALLPGQSTFVTLSIPAPVTETDYFGRVDGDVASGVIVECDESNNSDLTTGAACNIVQ